ncbi:exonuclease RecJ [Haloplanus rubicundus]|uniref:Exonuclease RecJ n=1 Tax=Haloplanus rubicundus TaxID=1547898 RepID=A0A345E5U3_9EURY|nr:exonuclease RecJ [Haloplanus rubicundus]AXG07565.1 exonuclease RecJ [Haloplanus rubicundus]
MSTAPAVPEDAADAGEIAAALREAPFVRVVAAADGDALAASGVLARACRERSTPFQVRVDPIPNLTPGEGDDLVVGVGAAGGDVALAGAEPASLVAAAAARELGVDPDPTLALAGVATADRPLDSGDAAALLDAVRERTAVERRPGLATPTPDLADGLAHSTLVSAPVSGDPEAAREALSKLDLPSEPTEEDRRRLASWLAIEATASSVRATEAVERALRPHATPDARVATIEGFGDALDAVARERPGTGVALAIRDDGPVAATLDAWRGHARAVHEALTTATTGRYDGVFVARVDEADPGRLGTVARLCRDFQSPEPVVLVVGGAATAAGSDGAATAAAAASVDDARLADVTREAVRAVDADGSSAGDARRATARFDADGEVSRFITAFREAL